MTRRIGIVRDSRYLEHKTGVHHIELPSRLETIYSMLDRSGLMSKLTGIPPRFASLEEIEMVHAPEYVEKILDTAGEQLLYLDPDTVTSERTCEAAFLSAGGVLAAVEQVMDGSVDSAFALTRPPGHHAERNRQMGFCIFNNIALAAEFARRRYGLTRVLIVDWDLHHGNGTQHAFEKTAEVLFFSSHRFPFFPGMGDSSETGLDAGRGFTVNVPMPPGKNDTDFCSLYHELLLPVAREFQPQLVLVSAGFDTHFDDPIGGMRVSEAGYAYITDLVMRIAREACGGKVVIALEGGYDLGAMRMSSRAVLETLLGGMPDGQRLKTEETIAAHRGVDDIVRTVRLHQAPYWKCFRDV